MKAYLFVDAIRAHGQVRLWIFFSTVRNGKQKVAITEDGDVTTSDDEHSLVQEAVKADPFHWRRIL